MTPLLLAAKLRDTLINRWPSSRQSPDRHLEIERRLSKQDLIDALKIKEA